MNQKGGYNNIVELKNKINILEDRISELNKNLMV